MRPLQLLCAIAGAVALASASFAQQPFGSWVHDNGPAPSQARLAVYVKVGASPTNSGLLPTSPLPTLDMAVALADRQLAAHFGTVHKGVTINVFPGTYFLAQWLSVPAYGMTIEPYKDIFQPTGVVEIRPTGAWAATIQFDAPLGPQCIISGLTEHGMPPSVLRGLDIYGPPGLGASVAIDPTAIAPYPWFKGPVAVEINQCKLEGGSVGLQISNVGNRDVVYACQIIDNEITLTSFGVNSIGKFDESNLYRSNRIHACYTGMQLYSQVVNPGRVWHRILSNAIYDIRTDPLTIYPQYGISIVGGSAQVVNNTIAYVKGSSIAPADTASFSYATFMNPTGAGDTVVLANNLLWSPPFTVPFTATTIDPDEIQLPGIGMPGTFAGTATIVSNDFHITNFAAFAGSATNTAITDPRFWNMGTPYDVHLTPPSPSASVANQGDPNFVLPGPTTTIVTPVNNTFLANCALDMDLDARTNQSMVSFSPVLNRGADQLTWDGIQLSAPTSGALIAQHNADEFGALVPDSTGATQVLLQVDGPANATYATFLCSTLPMSPELQHVNAFPIGSAAIDPAPANSFVVDVGVIGAGGSTQSLVNLGVISPTFLEAEFYLQTVVFRVNNGPTSFSNRIRLDVDRN